MTDLVSISTHDAQALEQKFLDGLGSAQAAFEQIMATQAWTVLGYATFTSWWETRVVPIMKTLWARPEKEVADKVIKQIAAEDEKLPKAQRRGQRQIADLVGVSQMTVSRSLSETNGSNNDLDAGQKTSAPAVIKETVATLHESGHHDLAEQVAAGVTTVEDAREQIAAQVETEKQAKKPANVKITDLLVILRKLRRQTAGTAEKVIALTPLNLGDEADEAKTVLISHINWIRTALNHIESALDDCDIDQELRTLLEEEDDT